MGELIGDLKVLVDEKLVIVFGWIDCGKLVLVDLQYLIFMIWVIIQYYVDFVIQVEVVIGVMLQDVVFFE